MANPGSHWELSGDATGLIDLTVTADGLLKRDDTVISRCLVRLLTRRGEWFGDPELGSRLHELKILKNPKAQVEAVVLEALQPLIEDGSLSEITVTDVDVNNSDGFLLANIELIEADGTPQRIGPVPLGRPAAPNESTGFDTNQLFRDVDVGATRGEPSRWGIGVWGLFRWGQDSSNSGDGWAIGPAGDYRMFGSQLRRDPTIETRCRIRLMTRRGEYFDDVELGSRFHEIKILKNAESQLADMAQLALQPMIDDGSILSIETTSVEVDQVRGILLGNIIVNVPGDSVIRISGVELG